MGVVYEWVLNLPMPISGPDPISGWEHNRSGFGRRCDRIQKTCQQQNTTPQSLLSSFPLQPWDFMVSFVLPILALSLGRTASQCSLLKNECRAKSSKMSYTNRKLPNVFVGGCLLWVFINVLLRVVFHI